MYWRLTSASLKLAFKFKSIVETYSLVTVLLALHSDNLRNTLNRIGIVLQELAGSR